MTWPVTEQTAKAELLTHLPYLNGDKYLDDFAKIGHVLASSEQVKAGLSLIEKDLTAAVFGLDGARALDLALTRRTMTGSEVARKKRKAQEYYEAWNKRLPENLASGQKREDLTDETFSHLVTKEFGALELQGGFWTSNDNNDPSDPPYKVMLMTPLSGKGFLKNLTHGRPWKDIVGPNHGEYTHRLQWCILIRGHHVGQPVEVFKHIGTLAPIPIPNTKFSFTIWDALFDRIKPGDPNFVAAWPFWAEDKRDFRGPEVFLDWLCSPDQQKVYPLLAGFLKARKEKRQFQQTGINAGNFSAEYLSRKVWGQEYSTLSEAEKNQLLDYLDDAVGYGAPALQDQNAEKGIGLVQPTSTGYQFPHIRK